MKAIKNTGMRENHAAGLCLPTGFFSYAEISPSGDLTTVIDLLLFSICHTAPCVTPSKLAVIFWPCSATNSDKGISFMSQILALLILKSNSNAIC